MDALALAIAIAGAVLVLWALTRCLRRRINAPAADQIVLKLARAGNVERITKLAAAAPHSYLEVYAEAIRAASKSEAKDPVTIAALTHPAFDRHAAVLEKAWRAMAMTGLTGAALGAVGLYLGYTQHSTPQHLRAVGGLAAIAGVWFLFHLGDVTRAVQSGRTEVLPEIDRAFTGVALESTE